MNEKLKQRDMEQQIQEIQMEKPVNTTFGQAFEEPLQLQPQV